MTNIQKNHTIVVDVTLAIAIVSRTSSIFILKNLTVMMKFFRFRGYYEV